MTTQVVVENAKKVTTFDLQGNENGFLMELFKDGEKTVAYLSAALPGAFKGYHLHRIRAARYVCIKGTMKVTLYINDSFEEYILNVGDRIYIPKNIPTGLQNIGHEVAWLINYPDPPYDPNIKNEQVDYTEAALKSGKFK